MTLKQVTWFNKKVDLSEIYQSFDMKFAFAGTKEDELYQCHSWVKCRDFLHDAVRTMLTGKKSQIYGFNFAKDNNPAISMNNIQFLVSNKQINSALEMKKILNVSLKLINHFEKVAGQKLSTLKKVKPDKISGYTHVWLITGPKFWLSAPHLVSLYTFLLRLGSKNIKFKDSKSLKESLRVLAKQDNKENDIRYLKDTWNKLEIIVQNHEYLAKLNKEGFSELYFSDTPIGSFHNNSGIVSACKAATWSIEFNKRVLKLLKENK